VLAIDWYGLLYLFRGVSMRSVLLQAHRMTPLIWLGLLGLTVTGGLLKPDLESLLIVLKMRARCWGSLWSACSRWGPDERCCGWTRHRPRSLMLRGMVLTAASQSLWWTAVVVGSLTHQARH